MAYPFASPSSSAIEFTIRVDHFAPCLITTLPRSKGVILGNGRCTCAPWLHSCNPP
jgi:hypothetical protein